MQSPFQPTDSNPPETQGLSEFGSQFLDDSVPPEHRAIVEQYIKPWDGNVTKKFQELQGKVKTFEELGDVDTLTSAQQILSEIQSDPVGFFNYYRDYLMDNEDNIKENYGIEDLAAALGVQMDPTQTPQVPNPTGMPEFEGVPPQFIEKFQALEQELAKINDKTSAFEQSQAEKENMQMLDNALAQLHTEHGDFDDDYVLSKVAAGKEPKEAIEMYQQLVQSAIDSQSKRPPTLMSGPAGSPLDQVDKTKLGDAKYRKQLGAEFLSKSLSS